MASKYEQANYLANLISILDSQDDAGGMIRSTHITDEYRRAYAEFKATLEQEQGNETRTG